MCGNFSETGGPRHTANWWSFKPLSPKGELRLGIHFIIRSFFIEPQSNFKLRRSLIFIEKRSLYRHSTPYGVEQMNLNYML